MTAARKRGLGRPDLGLLLLIVSVAWCVELADVLLGSRLESFGIYPRHFSGLPGVFLSPWLHRDWGHLIANTVSFFGLGMVMLMAEGRRFLRTTFLLVVIGGCGTWLIGRPAIHIGASGLIYGYFGYVLARAVWERRLSWAVMGIVVGVIYGGMIWGVLPTRSYVSWEAHLTGLIAGLWLGRAHAGPKRVTAVRR